MLSVLILALAVRLAGVNFESFSMDEVTDLKIAHLPLQQIVVKADGFPPLYHLLLKAWLSLWTTPLAARWLSALLGVATVYAVYRLAQAIGGRPTGLAAGALAALSPVHVWFAQESRAYALALPLTALVLWRFWEAYVRNSRADWLIYAVVVLLAVCTHYFIAIVVALQALWLLPAVVRGKHYRGPALLVYGALALLAIPVLLLLRADFLHQTGTGGGGVGLGAPLYSLYAFLLGFSTGLSLRELHDIGLQQAAGAFLPWIAALGACLLPLGILWSRRATLSFPALSYLLVTSFGPVAVTMAAATVFELKYKVSYVVWASIPLLVLLGDAVAKSWDRRLGRAATAAFLILMLAALGNRHLVDRYRTEDVRSAAAYLEVHATADTPIFVVAGYMAEPLAFYLGPEWPVRAIPKGPRGVNILSELAGNPAGGRAWIVYTRAFDGDPTGEIRQRLATGGRSRLAARFPGVDLYRIGSEGVSIRP